MRNNLRNFKVVPNMIFSYGAIKELPKVVAGINSNSNFSVYIVDHFFKGKKILPLQCLPEDLCYYLDTAHEPTTDDVDHIAAIIREHSRDLPRCVIGVGGGSTLDMAKAVATLLTNPGSSMDYQGWDLVKNRPVYKIGIPTLSGTGSEASRTTVLKSKYKKQGINSDYSLFDQIILDPDLLETVPSRQKFFTGMDCYIHCVESLSGTYLNAYSLALSQTALSLCQKVFLKNGKYDDLMVASLLGGQSIVYSEVGVCHALSYGLSHAFGTHHGEANCIVFDKLEEYYPQYVPEFKQMLAKHDVILQSGLTKGISEQLLEQMIDITLLMEKPLENALGPEWRSIFTREKIKELYKKM